MAFAKQKILENKKILWCLILLAVMLLVLALQGWQLHRMQKILGASISCNSDWNNGALCYEPAVAPPKAGEVFTDPVFKTKLVRLTDEHNSSFGAGLNSDSYYSTFNSDGTLFYLNEDNGPTELYSLDASTHQVARLGALSASFNYDGAAWDKSDPKVLFATSDDSGDVVNGTPAFFQLTITSLRPLSVSAKLLTDFYSVVPVGTTFDSSVDESADGSVFVILATTPPNQSTADNAPDLYDTVMVWNKASGRVTALDGVDRVKGLIQNAYLDASGQKVLINTTPYSGSNAESPWYLWDIAKNSLVTLPTDETFTDQMAVGSNSIYQFSNSTLYGRSLASPATPNPLIFLPQKKGKDDPYELQSSSQLLSSNSFFSGFYVAADLGFPLSKAAALGGGAYEIKNYLAGLNNSDFDVPEFVSFNGLNLAAASTSAASAGQWFYNQSADTLRVFPYNNVLVQNSKNLSVFDWRPLMDEIVQFSQINGQWVWRRLAHHHVINESGDGDTPALSVSPTGTALLFESNWDGQLKNPDGSSRSDVFLLFLPPQLSDVSVSNVTSGGAVITWTTAVPTDGRVDYGLDQSYGALGVNHTLHDGLHTAVFTNLTPHTTYHVKLSGQDSFGSVGSWPDLTFTTQ